MVFGDSGAAHRKPITANSSGLFGSVHKCRQPLPFVYYYFTHMLIRTTATFTLLGSSLVSETLTNQNQNLGYNSIPGVMKTVYDFSIYAESLS